MFMANSCRFLVLIHMLLSDAGMSGFLKVLVWVWPGIVLLLCGLIALYYFESKAALRADIKACPTVTAGQATDAVIQDILVNRERIFSKPQLERRDMSD